jgi:hypothetical protein
MKISRKNRRKEKEKERALSRGPNLNLNRKFSSRAKKAKQYQEGRCLTEEDSITVLREMLVNLISIMYRLLHVDRLLFSQIKLF